MRTLGRVALLFAGICLGCGSSTNAGDPDSKDAKEGTVPERGSGQQDPDTFGEATPASGDDTCNGIAKDVYVQGDSGNLYRFDPAALKFTLIGPLNCRPAGTMQLVLLGMGMDRSGKGYLTGALNQLGSYEAYSLFTFDPSSGSCTEVQQIPTDAWTTGYPGPPTVFLDRTARKEIVYGTLNESGGPTKLATVNSATFQMSPVGAAQLDLYVRGFTATGDGKLYALQSAGGRSVIAEVDPTTGTANEITELSFQDPGGGSHSADAMVFWGGSFWLFGRKVTGGLVAKETGTVWRYELAKNKLSKVLDPAPEVVTGSSSSLEKTYGIGAVTSTCAPVVEPK